MLPKNYLSLCHYDLKTADGHTLHQNLHLDFFEGQVLLIKGSNGSGKTTLIHSLVQMLEKNHHRTELLPQLMNLKSSIPCSLADILHISNNNISTQSILDLGLLDRRQLDLSWSTASGGEKKRALLTRCLLMNPEILILDEPFNHLDSQSVERICLTLTKLLKEKTLKGVIIVSHPVYLKHPSFEGIKINEVEL